MRALLDANLFVSYLLSQTPLTSAMGAILAAAAEERFTLLFTSGIADEIVRSIAARPDLSFRITPDDVTGLLADLDQIGEAVPRLTGAVPAISRDPKDDDLIAHATVAKADVLVSSDNDVLVLREIDGLRIVSPAEFLHELRAAGLL